MVQTRKCKRGQILRDAYVRTRKNKRTYVAASCIKKQGLPGAKGYHGIGPGIGPLRKGDLAQFGYQHVTTMSATQRHAALALAVKAYGSLTVRRKLNAIYVYTRNTAPASSAIFKADRNWVKAHYA
jgi:hypothetical protein